MVVVRYTDGTWNYARGVKCEEEVLTAAELVSKVRADDPFQHTHPATRMVLQPGGAELTGMTTTQLEGFALSGTVDVVLVRDEYGKLHPPRPVVLGVSSASLVTLFLPPEQLRTRQRSHMDRIPTQPPSSSAIGIRYYDESAKAFIRVPHGGNIPQNEKETYRVAVEREAEPPSLSDDEESLETALEEEEEQEEEAPFTSLLARPGSPRQAFNEAVALAFPGYLDDNARLPRQFTPLPPSFGAAPDAQPREPATKLILALLARTLPSLRFAPLLSPALDVLSRSMSHPKLFAAGQVLSQEPMYLLPRRSVVLGSFESLIKQHLKLRDADLATLLHHWVGTLFSAVLPSSELVVSEYVAHGTAALVAIGIGVLKLRGAAGGGMDQMLTDAEEAKVFALAKKIPVSKKDLGWGKVDPDPTSSDVLAGGVVYRPSFHLGEKGQIVKDAQTWEIIYSWLPSWKLNGLSKLIYAKNTDGVSLNTLNSRCTKYSDHPCLILVHTAHPGSTASAIYGYYLDQGLCMGPSPRTGGASFPFALAPLARRLPYLPGTSHCFFPSPASLSLGVVRGIPFMSFPDLAHGDLAPVRTGTAADAGTSSLDSTSSAMGHPLVPPSPALHDSTFTTGGKFQVINFEVFVFES